MEISLQITHAPTTWEDLQNEVGQILHECGFKVEVEKLIETVRGTVKVDVYAEDHSRRPEIKYIIECKQWKKRVPKTIAYAIRTVVSDSGANVGLIVSVVGFQKGAYDAVKNSPVRLANWQEFQDIFIDVWIKNFLTPTLSKAADPLIEYTEPINSRIFRKANLLSNERQNKFEELRKKYFYLAMFALPLSLSDDFFSTKRPFQNLPLKESMPQLDLLDVKLSDDILGASTLRELLESLSRHCISATLEFDEIFGERA